MTVLFSLFCRDIDAQVFFYQSMFDWPEDIGSRSPIFRGLRAQNALIGFHAPAALDLLGLANVPSAAGMAGAYPTIQVPSPADVDAIAAKAVSLGGTVVKAPFATYYDQWQAVLRDPEGHLLRLACLTLPDDVSAPPPMLARSIS